MSLFLSKTRQWMSVIRLVPFDTATADGRSKERLRRVALTALVSAISQGVNVLTMLISVPLTLNYLGYPECQDVFEHYDRKADYLVRDER